MHNSALPSIFLSDHHEQFAETGQVLSAAEAVDTGSVQKFVEHQQTLLELADRYDSTDIDLKNFPKSGGLKSTRAEFLLDVLGANKLSPPPRIPLWLLFLLQFTNLFMILLMVAAFFSLGIYLCYPNEEKKDLYLAIILFIVVIATCYETYAQEAKSDELMESFRKLVPEVSSVIRDGTLRTISSEQLVVGDLLRLTSGDKVPADCRIIACQVRIRLT
jgi:sodium/potassium-transporting ATPase subunit alpha